MADATDNDHIHEPTASGAGRTSPDANGPTPRSAISLANLGHGLKLAALLLFLLPWVTVSCAEHTLVSLSGMDLATGSVTVTNPMTGEQATPAGSGKADLPVLIAALLIVAAFAAGFILKRSLGTALSIAGLAAAAALISYSVLYRLPARARESATADSAQGISETQIANLIRVDVAAGFWLTLIALASAIVLTFLSRGQAPPGRGGAVSSD